MNVRSEPRTLRWVAWGVLALVFLLVNVHRLSTAVLSEPLTAAFATSATALGALHASFFYVYAAMQIPTGALADRFGPRYVGSAGAVVLSLGALGFAASDGYLAAFLSRAVVGLGSSVIFVTILRFCANWFRADEFATMTGATAGVAGLGAILATTPLAVAVDAVGWRSTYAGLGVVGFVSATAVFALARRSPDEAGLEPIDGVPEQPEVSLPDTVRYLRGLATDPVQWLLSVVFFSGMGSLLTLLGLWGVPYLVVVYDLGVTTASYYTLLGAIGLLVGGPAIGKVSDRLGRRLLPMTVGLGLFALALAVVPVFGRPPLPAVAAAYLLSGFLVGAPVLALSIVKERYPAGGSGVATATVNMAGFVGAAVFPTLMGLALDAYRTGEVVGGTVAYTEFGYRVAFAILAGSLAVAFVCSTWLLLREGTLVRGGTDDAAESGRSDEPD